MVHKILNSSRYVVIVAVIGSLLAALVSLVYGGIQTILVVINIFQVGISQKLIKGLTVSFIEVIDLFLIGIVFYIISLGLYELFIDESLELPTWLIIHSFDDLKGKLISGMIVIMGVYYLGVLINMDGQTNILNLSISISLIITALTLFQFFNTRKPGH
jgi:uncharacterized membrane protein YqhA